MKQGTGVLGMLVVMLHELSAQIRPYLMACYTRH